MKIPTLLVIVLCIGVATSGAFAASSQTPTATPTYGYGYQLMTSQERNEMHTKMRAAATAEEREQLRSQQHALMTERAKTKGITLPAQPLAKGAGRGCDGAANCGGMGSRRGR